MRKTYLILFLAGASVCHCLAQPYPPQAYKEYIKVQAIERHATKKLDSLLKNNAYESILSYVDSLTTVGYDVGQHRYSAIAYSKLGNMPLAIEEAKKQIKNRPATPTTGFSNATGISLEILVACKKEVEQGYIQQRDTLIDTALCYEIAALFKKDQYKRPADSLQNAYFREGSLRLRQMTEERGTWLTRYLTNPESHQIETMLQHYPTADLRYFLSYIIPDCEQGYTSWQTVANIISTIQYRAVKGIDVPEKYPREYGRGYYGIYGIAINEAGEIDVEQSFIGLHIASGYMRRGSTVYLQATTSFTSERYLDELERLRQYYIALGIPPQLINIVNEKIEYKAESDKDSVTYVVARVEGKYVRWTNPIYFD